MASPSIPGAPSIPGVPAPAQSPTQAPAPSSPLSVTSEIGRLRRVCLHRPGNELLNLMPADLGRLLFDDIPFLEVAQADHDRFAALLRREGVEVLYLERLVAEALEAVPGARAEFTSQYLAECGVHDNVALAAIRELLDSIRDPYELVLKTMAGVTRHELELPLGSRYVAGTGVVAATSARAGSASTLVAALGDAAEPDTELIVDPMPNLYFTRDPFCVVGPGVNLNRMYQATRRRETIYGRFLFACHPEYRDVPLWYDRDLAYHVEGGDVLVLGERTICVGISAAHGGRGHRRHGKPHDLGRGVPRRAALCAAHPGEPRVHAPGHRAHADRRGHVHRASGHSRHATGVPHHGRRASGGAGRRGDRRAA